MITATDLDDIRVHDKAALDALPVGTKINATLKRDWWGVKADPDAFWEKQDDGWHLVHGDGRVSRSWGSTDLMFKGASGRRITRRVLNPEILGQFR